MLFEVLLAHSNDLADRHLVRLIISNRVQYNDFLYFGAIGNDVANLRQLLLAHNHVARIGVLDAEEQVGALGEFYTQWYIHTTSV